MCFGADRQSQLDSRKTNGRPEFVECSLNFASWSLLYFDIHRFIIIMHNIHMFQMLKYIFRYIRFGSTSLDIFLAAIVENLFTVDENFEFKILATKSWCLEIFDVFFKNVFLAIFKHVFLAIFKNVFLAAQTHLHLMLFLIFFWLAHNFFNRFNLFQCFTTKQPLPPSRHNQLDWFSFWCQWKPKYK